MQLRRAFQTLPVGAFAVAPAVVGSAIMFTVMGDSLTVSRNTDNLDENRTGAEPEVTGAMQYVNYSGASGYQTLSADVSPLWHPDDGTARISPFEDFLREYVPLTDLTPVMVPCGNGGSWLARPSSTEDWDPATPGTKLAAAEAAHNAALALLDPGSTVGAIFVDLTSNDYIGGEYSSAAIIAKWLDFIDYVRANFDGVSDSTPMILAGPCASGGFSLPREDIEYTATQRINVFVEHPPYPTADAANLHPTREENRAWGAALADVVDTVLTGSQAIPTFTTAGTQNATEDDQLAVALDHTGLDGASKYGVVEINGGADAAEFEIGGTWPNQVLRWASDGTGPETGDYVVNLRIRNGAWEYGSDYPVTVTVAAAGEISPATFFTTERGMVWDLSDISSLSQTIDGLTPVTAPGDPVGYVADKSGNGNHWIASANNTTRPTYEVDSDGKPYLQFNGSSTRLHAATPWLTGGTLSEAGDMPFTSVIGLNARTAADAVFSSTTRAFLSATNTTNTTTFVELMTSTSTASSAIFIARNDASGGGAALGSVANVNDGAKHVFTTRWAFNVGGYNRRAEDRPSGGGAGGGTAITPIAGTQTFTLTRSTMGARGFATPSGFYGGRIYSGFVIGRQLTDNEVKAGEDWVAARQLTSTLP